MTNSVVHSDRLGISQSFFLSCATSAYRPHHLVQSPVIAFRQFPEHIGPLKNPLSYSLWHPLRQDHQFVFVGLQGVGQPVDQGVGRVIAEIQPLVLDSTQVGEANADLLGQITQAPILGVSKLSNPFPKSLHKVSPRRHLLVAACLDIS